MLRILLICTCLLSACYSWAGHLIGGEMTYECLGNNQYVITLKMYRDCNASGPNVSTTFDVLVRVSFYPANGDSGIHEVIWQPADSAFLPLVLDVPCLEEPPDICVVEMIYSDTFELDIPEGGMHVVNQRCCRTPDALNVVNPSVIGSTYYAFIPDPEDAPCNSSPIFNRVPPKALCSGIDLSIDYTATDRDGDSLSYSFCDPLIGGAAIGGQVVPNPPAPPPYSPVGWQTGFNTLYQIPSSPVMQIDSLTGTVYGRPNSIGTYVFGVCVSEYRDGKYLSTNRRDFQMTTTKCEIEAAAQIDSTIEECVGLEVQFYNLSTFGDQFLWDFGDTLTANDTSTAFNPSYVFPDTGLYTITLAAFGDICSDTSTLEYYVGPRLQPEFTPPPSQCLEGNSFDFQAGGFFNKDIAEFEWTFAQIDDTVRSMAMNPEDVQFNYSGTFPVWFRIQELRCDKTYLDSVTVVPNPRVEIFKDDELPCIPYTANFWSESEYAYKPQYLWYFGNGDSATTNPASALFSEPGRYDVRFRLTTDSACIDTVDLVATAMVVALDTPIARFSISPELRDLFQPDFSVKDSSVRASFVQYYLPSGDSTTERQFDFSFPDTGTFAVSLHATSKEGCTDTLTKWARVEPQHLYYAPNTFTPDDDLINDQWRPEIFDAYDYNLTITDRWGHPVYQSKDQFKAWDGTQFNSGEKCPIGTYFYMLDCVDHRGRYYQYQGQVVLLR